MRRAIGRQVLPRLIEVVKFLAIRARVCPPRCHPIRQRLKPFELESHRFFGALPHSRWSQTCPAHRQQSQTPICHLHLDRFTSKRSDNIDLFSILRMHRQCDRGGHRSLRHTKFSTMSGAPSSLFGRPFVRSNLGLRLSGSNLSASTSLTSLRRRRNLLWKWMVRTTQLALPLMLAGTGISLVPGIACCIFQRKLLLSSCQLRWSTFGLLWSNPSVHRALRAV